MCMRNKIFIVLFIIFLVLIGGLVSGTVTMGIWNYIIAPICDTHKITFWQGLGVSGLLSAGISCLKTIWKSDRP